MTSAILIDFDVTTCECSCCLRVRAEIAGLRVAMLFHNLESSSTACHRKDARSCDNVANKTNPPFCVSAAVASRYQFRCCAHLASKAQRLGRESATDEGR